MVKKLVLCNSLVQYDIHIILRNILAVAGSNGRRPDINYLNARLYDSSIVAVPPISDEDFYQNDGWVYLSDGTRLRYNYFTDLVHELAAGKCERFFFDEDLKALKEL